MRNFFLLFMWPLLMVPLNTKAQNSVFDLFKSRLKLADELFMDQDYSAAVKLYKSIEATTSDSIYVRLQLARASKKLNMHMESLNWYSRISDSSVLTDEDKLNLSELQLSQNQVKQAQFWINEYKKSAPSDSRIQHKLNAINNSEMYYTDSLSFIVENLPLNTEESDFFPYEYDDQILFISSRPNFSLVKNYSNKEKAHFFQIYKASKSGSDVSVFSKKISSPYHEGPFCFLADGKIIVFSKSNRKSKKVMLYTAEKKGNEWHNIKPLPFNNKCYSVGHPFFNEADSCLYFASDMPGGKGGTDLYRSRLRNGAFSEPELLEGNINTEGNELFPFIFGEILAFTSDGHAGLGGKDIFLAKSSYGKIWDKLENPGYPINTTSDDYALFISAHGSGYFSSNREGGKGKDDIYSYRELKQIVHIKLQEKFNSEGINNVVIEVKQDQHLITVDSSSSEGTSSLFLKPGKKYTVTFSKKGYKNKDTVLVADSFPEAPVFIELALDRKNKAYIKGILWSPDETKIPNGKVKVVNKSTGAIDTIRTDEDGEFFAQIDPDYLYVLVVESDTLAGYAQVINHPKKRGSSVSVFDIFTGPEIQLSSTIQVVDSVLKLPSGGSVVEVKNLVTGEKWYTETDENGICTITTSLLFEYEITARCNSYPSEAEMITLEKREYTLILK